jgi:hypothetical protein
LRNQSSLHAVQLCQVVHLVMHVNFSTVVSKLKQAV